MSDDNGPDNQSYATTAIGFLLASSLICNLLVPHFVFGSGQGGVTGVLVIGLMLGLCAAQLNLVSIWGAIGGGVIVLRVPWTLLMTVMIWYALLLGAKLSPELGRMAVEDAAILGAGLLTATCVTQAALWVFGRVFGWCLMAKRKANGSNRTFDLKQLLLGMTMLSASLTFVRLVLPDVDWKSISFLSLANFAILLVAPLAANAFLVVTVVWFWARFYAPTIFWLLWIPLVTVVELGLTSILFDEWGWNDPTLSVTLILLGLNFTQYGTMLFVLAVLRAVGIELIYAPDFR